MKKTVAVVLLGMVAQGLVAAAPDEVYLLIGQSNMAGRGKLADAPQISTDRVYKFGTNGTWETATPPVHWDSGRGGFGPGLPFGRATADARPGVTVGLVPCAVGGTATSGGVSHWLGGRNDCGEWVVGGLFRELSERAVKDGAAILPTHPEGKTCQPYAWLPWFIHGVVLDSDRIALLYDRVMAEEKVDVLFDTTALDVEKRGDFTEANFDLLGDAKPEAVFYTHQHNDHYSASAATKAGVKRAYVHRSWAEHAKAQFVDGAKKQGLPSVEVVARVLCAEIWYNSRKCT